MAYVYTELSCYPTAGDYHFTSQSNSTTFQFRKLGAGGNYFPADPENYLVQVPDFRGSETPTIGGSKVLQNFGQFECDYRISFNAYLTLVELKDMIAAKGTGKSFKLKDFYGDSYVVTFDYSGGLNVKHKIPSNNAYYVEFKFIVEDLI